MTAAGSHIAEQGRAELIALAENLSTAAGASLVSQDLAARLRQQLPAAESLGLTVEAVVGFEQVGLRVHVGNLAEAGYKNLVLLDPGGTTGDHSGSLENLGQARLTAAVWPAAGRTSAAQSGSSIHITQAFLTASVAADSHIREMQQQLDCIAAAMQTSLEPHAQALAESAAISLLGQLPHSMMHQFS